MQPRRYVVLGLWVLTVDAWFEGPIVGRWAGPGAALPLAVALLACIGWEIARRPRPAESAAPDDRRFLLAVAVVAMLATLIRLPALAAPASLISSDSAVAGIIAQELAAGQRPAPIYAPGFPYEGTLKPHLTALLSWLLPGGIPATYAWTSHLFHLLWTVAVMVLARHAAGLPAAVGAGLFMALSPRFLVAFSLNNVGQYPEVNALGALALVALGTRGALLAAGFLLGLAVWQQLLAVYFVATAAVLVLVTPALRRPRGIVEMIGGFLCGSYPMWVWNAANGWATFDLFRRGGKQPVDRIAGLPDRIERTLAVSFPKMFGLTDLGAGPALALVLGALLPALVIVMAVSSRADIKQRRGRSPALVALVLFVVVLSLFAASKFSHRGAQRPRYLMPLYTSVAVAFGWGIASLGRRSRVAAGAAAATVLGANLVGLTPWLQGRSEAEARDRALLAELDRLEVRTGYAGFWVAPKYTFLAQGRVVLSGELGPIVSWVHPGHAARVRESGPDAYLVGTGELASAFEARLNELACPFQRSDVSGVAIFHDLGRRVSLEEVAGYDLPAGTPEPPEPLENDP
jgi:hypothetical protein